MGSRRHDQGTRSLHCRGYDTVRIGERELREAFGTFGKVIDVYLPKDYFTKKVRGFAYIQFENDEEADAARDKLDRTDVFGDNRIVNIMWAAGERKTPTDMRRLDIERDNPHARRAVQKVHGRDWEREWERDRERIRRERGGRNRDRPWDGPGPAPRDRRDGDYRSRDRDRRPAPPRDRSRSPRDRSRGFGFGGGRPASRSPPRFRDNDRRPFDDKPRGMYYDRRDRDDRDRPDYGRKRGRSRTPSPGGRPLDEDFDHRRRRRREASRSPPPVRRRSGTPPFHGPLPDPADRPRLGSRTPTPPRDRSPYARNAAAAPSGQDGWDRREAPPGHDEPAPRLRSSVAPKLRSAPLSPVEMTPASPDSR